MILGIVANPSLMGMYVQKWMESEQVKKAGFEVLQKASFTCAGCKIQSLPKKGSCDHGWLTPVDLKHAAFAVRDASEGIALCPVCLACQSLNHATSPDNLYGSLIYAPGFTQEQISRLAILSGVASKVLAPTEPGRQIVIDIGLAFGGGQMRHDLSTDKAYGGMDNDFAFAMALSSLSEEQYELRAEALKNIKFWPSADSFDYYYQHLAESNPNLELKKLKAAGKKILAELAKDEKKRSKAKKAHTNTEQRQEQKTSEAPF